MLAEAFGARLAPQEAALVDAALSTALAQGRARFPLVVVDDLCFVRYLAERIGPRRDPAQALRIRHTDDLFLTCGCVAGDPAALAAFEVHALEGAAEALRQLDEALPPFVDEVVQLVRIALMVPRRGRPARIARYDGRDPLQHWVKAEALRIVVAQLRKREPESSGEAGMDAADTADDPERSTIRRRYERELATAFRAAVGSLPQRDRLLLRMHILGGLSIDAMGAAHRVHRATAARWLSAARDRLRDRTRQALKKRLRVTDAELAGLLVELEGGFDLALELRVELVGGGRRRSSESSESSEGCNDVRT
jgi:RNA polymerase sigma-70 factor (ECF subfamily)